MKKSNSAVYLLFFILFSALSPMVLHADEPAGLSRGQMIYVPAYSHIYTGNRESPFLLTITLSIRNIDPEYPISISSVDYFETQGKFLKKYLNSPITLDPLESIRYVVAEQDKAGGSGANFIVEWKSATAVNPPIVESIMIGTQSQQGISFSSRGRVILPTGK